MTVASVYTNYCTFGVVYDVINGVQVNTTVHCIYYTCFSNSLDTIPESVQPAAAMEEGEIAE